MIDFLRNAGAAGWIFLAGGLLLFIGVIALGLRAAERARWRDAQSGWNQLGDPADYPRRVDYWHAVAKAFYLPMLIPFTPEMREQGQALARRILARPELLQNDAQRVAWQALEQALNAPGRPSPSIHRDVRGALTEVIRSSP